MVNIQVFITALRVTWLRNVIQNDENVSWYALSGIDFLKVFSLGLGKASQFKQNIQNPFRKMCFKIGPSFIVMLK